MDQISQEVELFKKHYIDKCTFKDINNKFIVKHFGTVSCIFCIVSFSSLLTITSFFGIDLLVIKTESSFICVLIYVFFILFIILCVRLYLRYIKNVIQNRYPNAIYKFDGGESENDYFKNEFNALLKCYGFDIENPDLDKMNKFMLEMDKKINKMDKKFSIKDIKDLACIGILAPFALKIIDSLYSLSKAEQNIEGLTRFINISALITLTIFILLWYFEKVVISTILDSNYNEKSKQYKRLKEKLSAIYDEIQEKEFNENFMIELASIKENQNQEQV